MKIKLTNHLTRKIDRLVHSDEFYDRSTTENRYTCLQLLALVRCREDGFITVDEPQADGYVYSQEFEMGFNVGEYEAVK